MAEDEKKDFNLSEAERVKKYIRACPYLPPNSEIIAAALNGIDQQVLCGAPSGDHSDSCSSSSTASTDIHEGKHVVVKRNLSPKDRRRSCLTGTVLRSLLLDIPLMLLFAGYCGIHWVHRVHDLYLKPEHDATIWTDERKQKEMTYYARSCDSRDLTTKNGLDLFLNENATAKEAYEHQLHHGFTVFPRVLSEETATALRNHVVERNGRLKPTESIYVIENEKRFSLALGIEEPVVANAMQEMATNELFRQSLEEVLGPNPALFEMSTITSTYGAAAQWFHGDVIARASPVQFARAFGPSYSVFIQLQNTTKAMGSTAICPGTHMCPDSDANSKLCNEEGYQLVNEEGHWRAGDAVLMNMNSYHRGSAHTDPDGLDRVMLVMTFAPRPRTRSETRMMAQGITCSLRWDMWGNTLNDLANSKTAMRWPFTVLRALGLYKQKDADWGVDYVAGSLMRISNGDHGFRKDELETFVERDGGFWFLPKFLQGEFAEDESWYAFLLDTLLRCEKFALLVNKVAVIGYLFLHLHYLVLSWFWGVKVERSRKGRFARSLFRLTITHGLVYFTFLYANRYVDQSDWADDIRKGKLYTSPFVEWENEYEGPTTFPSREDVLIETRYGSDYLHMYNDFIGNHPGNRRWNEFLADGSKDYDSYRGLPKLFRFAMATYIVSSVQEEQGRFLYQRDDGSWTVMWFDDAVKHTERELYIQSNLIRSRMNTEIRFLMSECRFGDLRDTVLSRKFTYPMLKDLQKRLTTDEPATSTVVNLIRFQSYPSPLQGTSLKPTFQIPAYETVNIKEINRRTNLHVGYEPEEPDYGAWLSEGDDVEAIYNNKGKWYSYRGVIEKVSSTGRYDILHADGDREDRRKGWVRPFEPFYENEAVEVYYENEWQVCRILYVYGDDTYDVVILDDDDTLLEDVFDGQLRRRHRRHPLFPEME